MATRTLKSLKTGLHFFAVNVGLSREREVLLTVTISLLSPSSLLKLPAGKAGLWSDARVITPLSVIFIKSARLPQHGFRIHLCAQLFI